MNAMIMERPLTREELADRMRQYHAEIAPFVRHIAAIEAFRPPRRVLLNPDGSIELGELAPLPAEAQEVSDRCRDMIDTIRKSLFPQAEGNDA